MTAMVRALTSLAIFLLTSVAPKLPAAKTSGSPSAIPVQLASSVADVQAERELLDLTNQARAQAGVPPLQQDDGLTQAARVHAQQMAAQGEISHQFPGEPSLTDRIALVTAAHLDRAAENVAYAGSPERVENTLMNSPPHRENLMNPAYNVVGIGAVRNGNTLYVAEDFGHQLPSYSTEQASEMVAAGVQRLRSQERLPALQAADNRNTQAAACDMAEANSLNTTAPQARYVLRYTAALPDNIPPSISRAVSDRSLRAFAAGVCYARTASYPNGVYWVMLTFY